MRVEKRDGTLVAIDFNKIRTRLQSLVEGMLPNEGYIGEKLDIDPDSIAVDTCSKVNDGIPTRKLDEFAAEWCAYMLTKSADYGKLAARIIISNHHKNTIKYAKFSDMMTRMHYNYKENGEHMPLISPGFLQKVLEHKEFLDQLVDTNHLKDYECLDYFAFKTLERSYFLKTTANSDGKEEEIQERLQHLLMRVSFFLYMDLPEEEMKNRVIECYRLFNNFDIMFATPTLFNCGTNRPQLASCFLLGVHDSIDGMYTAVKKMAIISKWSGGIGVWLNDIRGNGSKIRGTNGHTQGNIPYIRVLNDLARHVDQGGGKRKGSIAIYMEPWHIDIRGFLDLRKNTGKEEVRARDLFTALYVPDLFMKRLRQSGLQEDPVYWSLMCPDECPGLTDAYGSEFEELYERYETEGRYREQIDIKVLYDLVCDSQIETGTPYMLYKDHINNKSNQKNLGTIKSSNLCCEIVEYSAPDEYACCNLGSLNLKNCVVENSGNVETSEGVSLGGDAETSDDVPRYDFKKLAHNVRVMTRSLNRVIDLNYYPVPETAKSNYKNRPIGIGVQGLAETFFRMRYAFESEEAQELNRQIFETIYYAALQESCLMAKELHDKLTKIPTGELEKLIGSVKMYYPNEMQEISDNPLNEHDLRHLYYLDYQFSDEGQKYIGTYGSFRGSPISQGYLQFDLHNQYRVDDSQQVVAPCPKLAWDWDQLRADINQYGVRNSLLVAPMPTASTGQIVGNTECFEPITSNLYNRNVLAGTFMVINKYLQQDLEKLEIWGPDMIEKLIEERGSVQNIPEIPDKIKELYKTQWEISKKTLINMSADRQAFIDQSQSFNIFIRKPDHTILKSVHLHGWMRGLKTGMYYLRTESTSKAQQFSRDIEKFHKSKEELMKSPLDADKKEPKGKKPVICTDEVCIMCSA